MSGIRKSLLQFVFSGAYMRRWNDKLRPMEMYEVDKQAHKMIIAWLLFTLNSVDMSMEKRLELGRDIVEGGLFDYFYRLVITDIKPPVYYRIKQNPEDFRTLSKWALGEMERLVRPLDENMWRRLCAWVERNCSPQRGMSLADDILLAAHTFASSWEFALIKPFNSFDPEIPDIDTSFRDILGSLKERILGMPELLADNEHSALRRFADLCGRLRFQIRWSQTPRASETSVLGHMFMVACYAYFFSITQNVCACRAQNNFFAGLLHDLPEVLTRDIISPVKKSVKGIGSLIRQYEGEEMLERVLGPLFREGYTAVADRLVYFLGLNMGSEFYETVQIDGQAREVENFETVQALYNEDQFDAKDGRLLKICDILAAFMEAYSAMRTSQSPTVLHEALWRMRSQNRDVSIGNIHLGALFEDFD